MPNVFAVPVFFITFRETLETSIIVAILLQFIKQSVGHGDDRATYKRLARQVWYGVALGVLICLVIGGGFIGAFYGYGKNKWEQSENIWEGVFAILASVIISIMGVGILRVSKLKAKWHVKLSKAMEAQEQKSHAPGGRVKRWLVKYAMFYLPFITVLREGLEAVVFIGGVGLSQPASSFPLAVICGLLCGIIVGVIIYKGGNFTAVQIFLIVSTCFLYLVAAGLLSKGVGYLEAHAWNKAIGGDAGETGSGPGSYDIRQSVWHVNCCSPNLNGGGGWGIFNALFGWTNSATYGTVISYNLYWIVVIACFVLLRIKESKGTWAGEGPKDTRLSDKAERSGSSSDEEAAHVTEKASGVKTSEVKA